MMSVHRKVADGSGFYLQNHVVPGDKFYVKVR